MIFFAWIFLNFSGPLYGEVRFLFLSRAHIIIFELWFMRQKCYWVPCIFLHILFCFTVAILSKVYPVVWPNSLLHSKGPDFVLWLPNPHLWDFGPFIWNPSDRSIMRPVSLFFIFCLVYIFCLLTIFCLQIFVYFFFAGSPNPSEISYNPEQPHPAQMQHLQQMQHQRHLNGPPVPPSGMFIFLVYNLCFQINHFHIFFLILSMNIKYNFNFHGKYSVSRFKN